MSFSWHFITPAENVPWSHIGGGDGAYCAIADGKDYYYVSSQNGNITRLELDEEGNRLSSTLVTPADADNFLFIHPFILDPSDTKIMYLPSGMSMWRNDDLTALSNNNPT